MSRKTGVGPVQPRDSSTGDAATRSFLDCGRNVLHFFVPSGMATDDPVAFAPPPSFGPFRVLHQIGIGALGPVFRTYEPTRDRLVAVKVFRLDITPEQAQVLADELARASDAGLFHPSIVEPIAAGVEGTVAYRAEEYVAAESLDAAMRHYAPAPLEKALPFLTQLAGAIDFARTAGIGHGALHLRDVFVTPEESRASGFGVVEALERVGLRAPVRRPYSAPERIAGVTWSTPADVFSLAAITYELLTGRRPSGTGEQIGPLTGEHLLEFGAGMRVVLARAMDEEPSRRYPTALAFASALEAAARGGRVADAVTAVGAITGRAEPPSALPSVLAVAGAGALAARDSVDEQSPGPDDVTDDLPLTPYEREDFAPVDDEPGPRAEFGRDDAAYSDIDDERDDDAAHYRLAGKKQGEGEREPWEDDHARGGRSLAGVPLAGGSQAALPLDQPWPPAGRSPDAVRAETDTGPVAILPLEGSTQGVRKHDTGRYGPLLEPERGPYAAADTDVHGETERPRPAVLPIAVTLILGLLIGFAAGYWAGDRDRIPASQASGAAVTTPQSTAQPQTTSKNAGAEPSTNAAAGTTAQPYSDQAIAQPPATAPPVPNDAPAPPEREPTRQAPPAPTTGRIVVTSTPSRASVSIDGKWRGRTPLTLERMRFGSYGVRVVAPGFTVAQERVTVSASEPAQNLALRLQRAPAPPRASSARGAAGREAEDTAPATENGPFAGSIFVDSRPRGARVLVDGRFVGTTPARILDVEIGSHAVRLELADHRAWTTSTRVQAGEETRVSGSLERIP